MKKQRRPNLKQFNSMYVVNKVKDVIKYTNEFEHIETLNKLVIPPWKVLGGALKKIIKTMVWAVIPMTQCAFPSHSYHGDLAE